MTKDLIETSTSISALFRETPGNIGLEKQHSLDIIPNSTDFKNLRAIFTTLWRIAGTYEKSAPVPDVGLPKGPVHGQSSYIDRLPLVCKGRRWAIGR
jgi:hypothetical protein